MSSAFVILNESFPINVDIPTTEIVENKCYPTLQAAMSALADIAEEFDVYVEDDANSVYVPTEGTHLESDEYYIVELEMHNG